LLVAKKKTLQANVITDKTQLFSDKDNKYFRSCELFGILVNLPKIAFIKQSKTISCI